MTNLTEQEIMQGLQQPFSAKDLEWRAQRTIKTQNGFRSVVVPYITNRAIQDRLDQVVGPMNWRNSYETWRDKGVLCGIAIKFNGEWVEKYDGADETPYEATKGGFSAAHKRAGAVWGLGRYLYSLDVFWVNVVDKKTDNSNDWEYINTKIKVDGKDVYVKGYWKIPTVPSWALPSSNHSSSNSMTGQQNVPPTPSENPMNSSQGNNMPHANQGQLQGEHDPDRENYTNYLKNMEKSIGLTDNQGFVVSLYNRVNPDHKVRTASEVYSVTTPKDNLRNYYALLKPVYDLMKVAQNHNINEQQLFGYAQIITGKEHSSVLSLFSTITPQHVAQITEIIRSEQGSNSYQTA